MYCSLCSTPNSLIRDDQPADVRPCSKERTPEPKLIILTARVEALKWKASPRSSPWTSECVWCRISQHSIAPIANSRHVSKLTCLSFMDTGEPGVPM